MKISAIAAAATILAATSAHAIELGSTGVSIGGELDTFYDVDGEHIDSVFTPKLGYSMYGIALSASTDLNIVEADQIVIGDQFDKLPVMELGASYSILNGAAKAYGEVDFDVEESDWTGAKVGVSFNF